MTNQADNLCAGKLSKCRSIIAACDGCVVAFSGGVDSSLLLALAIELLPADKVAAAIATSPAIAQYELDRARDIATSLGVRLSELSVDPLSDEQFRENTPHRCYFCKKMILAAMRHLADDLELATVMTGSNADDLSDHRPGSLAEDEFNVLRPLRDAGMTKTDIRAAAKSLGLPNWDAPSAACLISRIPYHEDISIERLKRIDAAEAILRSNGFSQLRVRDHGEIARIELLPEQLPLILEKRDGITEAIKQLGFTYVTVDLAGFRSGSMNVGL